MSAEKMSAKSANSIDVPVFQYDTQRVLKLKHETHGIECNKCRREGLR